MISSAEEEDSDSLSEPVAKKRDIVERRCRSAKGKETCKKLTKNKAAPGYACEDDGLKKTKKFHCCESNELKKYFHVSWKVLLL